MNTFREYFSEKGIFENHLYLNIKETLIKLHNEGYHLFVATSKPTVFAKQILKYHSLDCLFAGVVGSNMDHTRIEKTEIITFLILENNLDPQECLMPDDRKFDIIGAKNCNVFSVAVTYGHGTFDEIKLENPDFIISEFSEIFNILDRRNFY